MVKLLTDRNFDFRHSHTPGVLEGGQRDRQQRTTDKAANAISNRFHRYNLGIKWTCPSEWSAEGFTSHASPILILAVA